MSWLIAFFSVALADVLWALYVHRVKEGDALRSSVWAVGLFVVGAVAVIGYTSSPVLLIPSAAGAFAGTYLGVLLNKRAEK